MSSALLDALAFLTRVPVPTRRAFDLARAASAFPVVGALVGLVVGGVAVGASLVLPVLVAAVLAVAVETALTGALHLDGLADCADGCGGHDREARLRIMKDSSVGVYGVATVVLDLLLKVSLLAGLLEASSESLGAGWAVVAMTGAAWAVSRAAMLPLAGWSPYARGEGTGRSFVAGLSTGRVVTGLVVAVVLVGALLTVAAGVMSASVAMRLDPADDSSALVTSAGLTAVGLTAAVLLAAGLVVVAMRGWARRRLGGVTGDVLGAAAEVVVLVALGVLVAAVT